MSAHQAIKNRCVDCGKPVAPKKQQRCWPRCMSCAMIYVRHAHGLANMLVQFPLGSKRGDWEIIGTPVFRPAKQGSQPRWFVPVQCVCGRQKEALCQNLLVNESLSCGCTGHKKSADAARIHGQCGTAIYRVWKAIIGRCECKKHWKYASYGGRGITVCKVWRKDFRTFRDWALANGWREGLEIDRRDNNGHYSPGNCRFIGHKANQRNKRTNRIMEAFGEKKCLIEWTEDDRCVVGKATLSARLRYGWAFVAAMTTPVMSRQDCGRTRRKLPKTIGKPLL